MAIKDEISGDAGFELWDAWSARGGSYSARDSRSTWQSIKAGGATKIGTLFGIAKDYGFSFLHDRGVKASAPVMAEADAARLAEAKRRQRDLEAAEYTHRADQAARDAATLWGCVFQPIVDAVSG